MEIAFLPLIRDPAIIEGSALVTTEDTFHVYQKQN